MPDTEHRLRDDIYNAASESVLKTGKDKLLVTLQNPSGDIKGWVISFFASMLVSLIAKYGIDLSLSDATIIVTLLTAVGGAIANGWAKRRQDASIRQLKSTLGGLEDVPIIGPVTQKRAEHVVAFAQSPDPIPMSAEKWKAEMDKAKVDLRSIMK